MTILSQFSYLLFTFLHSNFNNYLCVLESRLTYRLTSFYNHGVSGLYYELMFQGQYFCPKITFALLTAVLFFLEDVNSLPVLFGLDLGGLNLAVLVQVGILFVIHGCIQLYVS